MLVNCSICLLAGKEARRCHLAGQNGCTVEIICGIEKSFHCLSLVLTKSSHLLQHTSLLCYTISMKLSSYAKPIGIHDTTAWHMWKRGQLSGDQLPPGTVIVEPPGQQSRHRNSTWLPSPSVASRSEHNRNRETQAERLITWYHAAAAGRETQSSKHAAALSTISVPRFSLCWPIKRSGGWCWSTSTGHLGWRVTSIQTLLCSARVAGTGGGQHR
jgi:hypothetical protein